MRQAVPAKQLPYFVHVFNRQPVTWTSVTHAHDLLAAHAHRDFHYDDAQQRHVGPPGYDSSDDETTPCSCHYHPMTIESLEDGTTHVLPSMLWCEEVDGVCGPCWCRALAPLLQAMRLCVRRSRRRTWLLSGAADLRCLLLAIGR